MRRGRNYKKVLITLDEECLALLETKRRFWEGFNQSAYIRRCIKLCEKPKTPVLQEETTVEYD